MLLFKILCAMNLISIRVRNIGNGFALVEDALEVKSGILLPIPVGLS
jgi:hypothetical protein